MWLACASPAAARLAGAALAACVAASLLALAAATCAGSMALGAAIALTATLVALTTTSPTGLTHPPGAAALQTRCLALPAPPRLIATVGAVGFIDRNRNSFRDASRSKGLPVAHDEGPEPSHSLARRNDPARLESHAPHGQRHGIVLIKGLRNLGDDPERLSLDPAFDPFP